MNSLIIALFQSSLFYLHFLLFYGRICCIEAKVKKPILVGKKTSTRCLKDVLARQARHLAKTSCSCLKYVLNTNLKDIFLRHLEDTFARYIVDVLQRMS